MRVAIAALWVLLFFSAASAAEVINVEFKFTPFIGDPTNADVVQAVAGTAHVYLNGVPYADQEVGVGDVPVMFDDREIAASVWIPTASCGPSLRKGRNQIRIEFVPADAAKPYRAQLRWASVMSEGTEESNEGQTTATNQSGEGVEDKEATGPVVFEREFQAEFAADLPWHHTAGVTSLSDAERKALTDLVMQRIEAFRPDFEKFYAFLEGKEGIDLARLKAAKCLDKAYAVGARIAGPPPDGIDFVTTGNPEVVIRARRGMLFSPADPAVFEQIQDEDVQMCLGVALSVAYPPRLVVVRAPAGGWTVVY